MSSANIRSRAAWRESAVSDGGPAASPSRNNRTSCPVNKVLRWPLGAKDNAKFEAELRRKLPGGRAVANGERAPPWDRGGVPRPEKQQSRTTRLPYGTSP